MQLNGVSKLCNKKLYHFLGLAFFVSLGPNFLILISACLLVSPFSFKLCFFKNSSLCVVLSSPYIFNTSTFSFESLIYQTSCNKVSNDKHSARLIIVNLFGESFLLTLWTHFFKSNSFLNITLYLFTV